MANIQRPANSRPQNGSTQKKRRKKKKNDNYLYIGVSLLILAIILIAVIIFIAVGCDGNEEESSQDVSSVAAESSTEISEESSRAESSIAEAKGWQTENGNKYYIGDDGSKYTGVNKIDGSIYVFSDDGSMQKGGFVTVGKDIYHLNADGTAYMGWLESDGETYYFQEDGRAAIGETEIDGKRHFFSSKGKEFIVANPWNSVSDQVEELVKLPSAYGHDTKGLIDKKCYNDLIEMMDDCYHTTGCNVYVVSGHRTYEYQERNYNNEVSVYRNQGYSEEEARRLAAEWVAVPGTSEHHLGLAVDIIDTASWVLDESQEDLEGQKWLMENCWKYGFILRYPKGTKSETGINYEPWHYRYLGRELAKEVHDSGLTLEGYIKSLG